MTGRTPSGLSFSEMEAQIDALMDEHIGTSAPGAAIAVVYEGEIIFSRGYGWADIENRVPVDPAATIFEYGSINKTLIWVAVMQLVEQGLLDLDADVRAYLPDSFVFEKPFTMRDILNHSAGFADYLLGLFTDEQRIDNFGLLEETLLALQPQQIFAPGKVSAYSNWGSALAAFIVQQVSGQDYADYERENILFPANMHRTLNQPDRLGNHAFLMNKAKGYAADGEDGFHEGAWAYIPLYPAGALNGTAEDLAAFIMALTPPAGESGLLFTHTDTHDILFSNSSSDPINFPGTHHGFIHYSGVLPAVGHSGGTVSFLTDFAFVPETRFGYVLLTNATGHMDFMPAFSELLFGSVETIAVAGNNLPSAAEVEGRFLSSRRYYGNFLEFISYAGLAGTPIIQINALDENIIQLSVGALGSAVYVQTEPYVFALTTSDSPFIVNFIPELRFRMEGGAPRQLLVGSGSDFTSLPAGRTMPFLIASLLIVALSAAFFLIAPIVLFIVFLIRRKNLSPRTRFDRFRIAFMLSGTLLALNNLLLFARFGINPFRVAAEVAFHIWLNYVFTGLAVLFFAGTIWSWRTTGEAKGKRKALVVITALLAALFILVLHNWKFFVLL